MLDRVTMIQGPRVEDGTNVAESLVCCQFEMVMPELPIPLSGAQTLSIHITTGDARYKLLIR